MCSKKSISVDNISKCYRVYDKPQNRFMQSLWRGKRKYFREFWAIKDVSFDIYKGETIGIIGQNGSGKSTILQIISGTLTPTSGKIKVNGRVAALLELGSGFNPEFTGRENAILNGAIMGLTRREMEERIKYIEEFAEIGEFIDQPVKVYSSGMYVRLAFACAINVDPDILVIDEALAVGDMRFQLKCIDKMKSFKKSGKTILFVSHDSYSVRNFCDQAIWMMDGKIYMRGDVNTVTERYQDFMKFGLESAEKNELVASTTPSSSIGDKHIVLTIDEIKTIDQQGNLSNVYRFGESISVLIDFTLHTYFEGVVGGVAIYDKQNTYVCGLNTKLDSYKLPSSPGKYQITLTYDELTLLPGTYFLDIGFFESSAVVILDYKSKNISFRVDSGDYFAEGITYLRHSWMCKG